MGDGIMGAPSDQNPMDEASQQTEGIEKQAEAEIRNKLVTDAYGTKIPLRRNVGKE
jgi:hypothetical protein